jgi:hypothetical protein
VRLSGPSIATGWAVVLVPRDEEPRARQLLSEA